MRWLLEWNLPEVLEIWEPTGDPDDLLFEGDSLEVRCEVGLRQSRPWLYQLAYRFDGTNFELRPKRGSGTKFDLVTDSEDFAFKRNVGRAWPLPRPIKTHLFPIEAGNFFQNSSFLGEFEFAYENMMDSIFYLGPLRHHPQREYHWSGSTSEGVGESGEWTIDAILAATRDGEMRNLGYKKKRRPFQEMISHWLNELGLIHEFRLDEIAEGTNLYRAMVKTTPSSVPVALTDVGFGVSQVLPALVLLYYVPEGSTVLMEQPEIHLHPSVQSGLADVMLNVAETRDVQIIVESHSEHLMRRFQRRVAEEKASSEDMKLYFVSSDQGVAQASDLELNEWGEIENWPDKFFGDDVGEIVAITKNALKRRMKSSQ